MRGAGHFPGYSLSGSITALESRLAALETQVGSFRVIPGEDDPSAGAGVEATSPALYVRTTGGVTTWYFKEGAADTAWVRIVSQVFDALLTASRLKASSAGTAALPAIALAGEEGMYQEAANQIGFAVAGVRYARLSAALLASLNGAISSATTLTVGQYLIAAATQTTNLAELTPFKTHNLALGAVDRLVLTTSDEFQIVTSITGGVVGRILKVLNGNAVGGDPVTLQSDNATDGTAANRLLHSAGLDNVIQAGGGSVYQYTSDSRWRLLLP